MAHCNDADCKEKRVESTKALFGKNGIESCVFKLKARLLPKWMMYIFTLLLLSVIVAAGVVWSDNRNMPNLYATKPEVSKLRTDIEVIKTTLHTMQESQIAEILLDTERREDQKILDAANLNLVLDAIEKIKK